MGVSEIEGVVNKDGLPGFNVEGAIAIHTTRETREDA